MLNSLSYSVTFPSTGRSLSANVDFQNGFGSITGPNEAGKTFVIEMVRYCLFGTAALRHKADSYQNLEATLNVTIRGVNYTIERGRKPRICQDGEPIAVGTTPVNQKVIEKLGYGLDVFDVANVANQGDLEKLGHMRPADRKRMVDSVIGLGVIEDLTKWCGDQANGFSREAEAISSVMREPVEPTKPERIVERSEVDAVLTLKSELDRIEGWLSVEKQEPVVVDKVDDNELADLMDLATEEGRQEAELQELQRALKALPLPTNYSDDELESMLRQHERADVWEEWDRLPNREYSIHRLEQMQSDWLLLVEHAKQDRIREQIKDERHHTCPSCQHEFPDDPTAVAELKAKLTELAPRPSEPPIGPVTVSTELMKPDRPPEPEKATRPPLLRKQIVSYQIANQKAAERSEIEARIASLSPTKEHRDAYRKLVEQVRDHAAFVKEMDAYLEWAKDREQRLVRAKELREATKGLDELQRLLSLSEAYQRDMMRHLKDVTEFARLTVEVETLRDKVDGWRKAKASLVTLRLLVKQHLLPSLNKVASHLLVSMTGGQRQSLVVDDEFEVTVDGQPLDTLSGSGKSVANLALRLGLGQVLTNNVFSVFIGDEIDAFMDADRAENTANTLRLLKLSISQILLVTHKYPPADFYIDLGTHEQRRSN